MPDKFSLGLSLRKKKKKDTLFPLLFDVSKYKKKSRFLHQLSPMRPCKAIQSVYNNHPPLTFAALYNCVINNRKLNGMCLVGKFHLFTKNKASKEHTG